MRSTRGGDMLERSVASIYDAALAPERWKAALDNLRTVFKAGFAASVTRSSDLARIDGIASGVRPGDYAAFLKHTVRESPFWRPAVAWYPGQVMRSQDLVSVDAFRHTRMFQEFWRPHDLEHGLRLAVARPRATAMYSINLIRSLAAGPFEDDELRLARRLMPHLRRAAVMSARLRHAELLSRSALAVLDHIPWALLLLRGDGRVLHANQAAARLAGHRDGLTIRGGLLEAATPAETAALRAVLARATAEAPRGGAIRLSRPGGGAHLSVLAIPIARETAANFPHGPEILVAATDPDDQPAHARTAWVELFGLTRAEADLAVALLAGREPRAIAEATGRSIATVRTLLARLMAKTGTGRQTELVRLLASLPRSPLVG